MLYSQCSTQIWRNRWGDFWCIEFLGAPNLKHVQPEYKSILAGPKSGEQEYWQNLTPISRSGAATVRYSYLQGGVKIHLKPPSLHSGANGTNHSFTLFWSKYTPTTLTLHRSNYTYPIPPSNQGLIHTLLSLPPLFSIIKQICIWVCFCSRGSGNQNQQLSWRFKDNKQEE